MQAETQTTPYEKIGGEPVVRKLVEHFYAHMDELPEAYGVRKLHPVDLGGSVDKLHMFLSGWLGGPQHYVQQFGHPRLRMRHFPFAIGEAERDQWLMCMDLALRETVGDEALRQELYGAFSRLADHMRNQGEA